MEAEPCSELAGGDMRKDNVKKDKKKKKEGKRKEAETKGQEQTSDAAVEDLAAESYEVEGKQSSKSKKSKHKRSDAGEDSAGDRVVPEEAKKRKKDHPVVREESSRKRTLDRTVENSVVERDGVEGKKSSKSKKSKHKDTDAGDASAADQVVVKEDKREKKHPVVLEESSQKETLDTTAENSVEERDGVEGKQCSKSKKSKHKDNNTAADQVVANEDKKRKKKHPVVLEKSSQTKNTSKDENGEIKERGKEGDKSSPELSENVSAGRAEAEVDGKNDRKKKKSKDGTRDGIKEKVKAAQSKNKGKRVSFADTTEVFRTEAGDGEGNEGGKKKKKKAAQLKNKGKRVSFADSEEVFGIGGGDNGEGGSSDESKFVHGQRFSPEENATLMEAIRDFIEMKQLGEKGFEMIQSSRKHKELRGCWYVIGKCLPHRPHQAIYSRARVLLSRSDQRKWTQEEKEHIRRFVQNNGTEWKTLARELGKCDIHVKDTWRRIKSENLKKGHWTQDEHQKLFDMVNLDLRIKAHQIKDPDNRKLRDNISWEEISDKLTTRNHKNCCMKWYNTLASPMVRKGIWADVDDYLMVEALQKDDAVCVEDVDWDSLLDHRSGEVCRQRWNQIVRGIGGHREKPFIEQVEVLSRRYCPEMIEYRQPRE
ncbi:DNA-binding protein REB1-like isoform X1 [Lolium rigidum]|uniref:DNA-binding protein REB1-like isoform X1 n=1 Tax=Lolium rigidum TaxID=89674 RepID=UPI001F5D314D|nr:DNA-binding protein REB1-like isoform X1 [Lolium rigidum]XP_047047177.1 DNA-binding protein REB1-like isoform X1 [Lolium rigidum]